MALTRKEISKRYYARHRDKMRERNSVRNRLISKEKKSEYDKTYYRRHPELCKEIAMKAQYYKRYGLTPEAFEELKATVLTCAICDCVFVWDGPPFSKPHVDHDHATGKVRSLLCKHCNAGLGQFRDSDKLLEKAAKYIVLHREGA
jgi:hypothetical protein